VRRLRECARQTRLVNFVSLLVSPLALGCSIERIAARPHEANGPEKRGAAAGLLQHPLCFPFSELLLSEAPYLTFECCIIAQNVFSY